MSNGSFLEFLTLFLFFVLMTSELLFFFYFEKKQNRDNKEYTKALTVSTIILKAAFLFLGVLNDLTLWLTTIFLYSYIWLLSLKFKYRRDYDLFLLINVFTLIISLFISVLSVTKRYYIQIIVLFGILVFFLLYRGLPYLLYRRKAITFKYKAYDAFQQKNYVEASNYLSKGINSASNMLYTKLGNVRSKLQKLMEKEAEILQNFLNKDFSTNKKELKNAKEIFFIPKVSKEDIKNQFFRFVLVTGVLLIIIFPFYFLT